jgi:isopenicillin-N epimerase
MTSTWADEWILDPAISFLNNGSFGACPRLVLGAQQELRDRLERRPGRFLNDDLEGFLDGARSELAAFLGADAENVAFVQNATTGVNAVLHSLRYAPGDELLTTDHEYNATLNALRFAADRYGAHVVIAKVPFPVDGPEAVLAAILERVTPRTRLAMVSAVTSPTGLVFPIAQLVAELEGRGIDCLVDAAHVAGMLPIDLRSLGATYVTGDTHKWLCSPKTGAFLHVRPDRQASIHPLTISHGLNDPRTERSRLHLEFDWPGTVDPTPYLSIPAALRFVTGREPGGWPAHMATNRDLAIEGRRVLCRALGLEPAAPESMLGSMAALPLPMDTPPDLGQILFDRYAIEVAAGLWPVDAARESGEAPQAQVLRVSAQRYNSIEQYHRLAEALLDLLPR